VSHKARVFKILKTPVSLDKTPAELRPLIGYEFFKIDPETGKTRELDEIFGPEAHRDFWLKLDDLAHDIVALLEAMEGAETLGGATLPESPAAAASSAADAPPTVRAPTRSVQQDAVYLAETTSDLREQRESLRRDLIQQGYLVLPDHTIPTVYEEATASIVEDLARSKMSIHPIGRNYGLVPEGGNQSLVEMQHELATLRAAQGGFARLVWIPSGLKIEDQRQRKVVEQLRLDPRIREDADLLESFFEDLRTMMQDWLKRDRTPAVEPPASVVSGGSTPKLYVIAEQRDLAAIAPWVDGLFEQRLEVIQPVFEGDESEIREYHEDTLVHCDGVLIFYGAGNELWLRRKLRELQKAPGYGRTKPPPPVAICLIGPRTPEKERFRTHEAMVAPQWDGFALEVLRPFIAQLKAGGSV
jgi:hypothetical protein